MHLQVRRRDPISASASSVENPVFWKRRGFLDLAFEESVCTAESVSSSFGQTTEVVILLIGMSKLHPVYAALDSYQYSRAIKLASALPDSNILGKCLLAHAYYKSGQRYPSIVTLHKILNELTSPANYFFELSWEVKCAIEALEERQQETSKPIVADTSALKKGKKGLKKKTATPPPTSVQAQTTIPSDSQVDLLEQLDSLPRLPDDWDTLPALQNAITDEVRIHKNRSGDVSFSFSLVISPRINRKDNLGHLISHIKWPEITINCLSIVCVGRSHQQGDRDDSD